MYTTPKIEYLTLRRLTHHQEQIDDICRKSKDLWEKQAAARSRKDAGKGEKPLKRPLNQPVLVSRGTSSKSDDGRRGGDERRGDGVDRHQSSEYREDEYDRRR
jgi:hypothetical protein